MSTTQVTSLCRGVGNHRRLSQRRFQGEVSAASEAVRSQSKVSWNLEVSASSTKGKLNSFMCRLVT